MERDSESCRGNRRLEQVRTRTNVYLLSRARAERLQRTVVAAARERTERIEKQKRGTISFPAFFVYTACQYYRLVFVCACVCVLFFYDSFYFSWCFFVYVCGALEPYPCGDGCVNWSRFSGCNEFVYLVRFFRCLVIGTKLPTESRCVRRS